MKKARILLGFSKLSDADLDVKANAILTALTGNGHFPNPQPSLEAFGIAIENFSAAVSASKTRHVVSMQVKRNMRNVLEQAMHQLAYYVSITSGDDRLMLVSSGFELSAEFSNPRLLANPLNFAVVPGKNSGEAMVSVNPVQYGLLYLCFYAPTPVVSDLWMHAKDKSPNLLITGLEPLKQYSFRIAVAGARGQLLYTDIITRMVI